jgi:hypothetical protein
LRIRLGPSTVSSVTGLCVTSPTSSNKPRSRARFCAGKGTAKYELADGKLQYSRMYAVRRRIGVINHFAKTLYYWKSAAPEPRVLDWAYSQKAHSEAGNVLEGTSFLSKTITDDLP